MTLEQHSDADRADDLGEAVLRALFAEAPAGLNVFDTELRLVRVSTASGPVAGFPLEEMLGRPVGEILRAFDVADPEVVVRTLRLVLETGAPVFDFPLRARSRLEPSVELAAKAAAFRLQDPEGTVLGLVSMVTDVTGRVRAETGLRLLNEAAIHVGTTLDIFRTAQEFCDVTVDRFADSVAVDLGDAVLRGRAPDHEALRHTAELRRVGFRSAGDLRDGVTAIGEIDTYPPGTPYRAALTTLAPQLLPRLGPDTPWLRPDRRRDAHLVATGVHSLLVVPIRARGALLGLAGFYRWRNPTPFDRKDLDLAEQLTAHAALCLDNARLYGRERSVARIMHSGAAHPDAQLPLALELAHTYLPAGFGGGWFDVIPLSGLRVALVAGDVTSGTLEPSAMSELRAMIQALSDLDLSPEEILERLHDHASRPNNAPPGSAVGSPDRPAFATCLYLVYDPVTRVCTVAAAGHPSPVLLHSDGRVRNLRVPSGPPLGQGRAEYTVAEHVLPEGATLVLFNSALLGSAPIDGAGPDPRDPAERLRPFLDASGPLQHTCDAAAAALATDRPPHDAFLLLARTRALGPDRTNSWTFANRPELVSAARHRTAAQVAAWGLGPELAQDTALVVSELVTNAVRYAKGPIRLRLIRGTALLCEVSDDSSTTPHLRRALDIDENGRGLFITAQLTQRWGVRPARRGKTIWAQLALPPDSTDSTDGRG